MASLVDKEDYQEQDYCKRDREKKGSDLKGVNHRDILVHKECLRKR